MMAIAIKSIPILKDDTAKAFEEKANAKSGERATVDFNKQVRITHAILKKAKLH
jgi:hypothetical protein